MGSHVFTRAPDPVVRDVLDSVRRIVKLLRLFDRATDQRLGLSGAQLFVLQKLADGDAVSVNELAARTHTHQSSVSVVVSRLVKRKLVARTTSPADARRLDLTITPAGRAVLASAPAAAQDRLIAAVAALPAGERRSLARLLARVVENAGIAAEAPELFFEEPRKRRAAKA